LRRFSFLQALRGSLSVSLALWHERSWVQADLCSDLSGKVGQAGKIEDPIGVLLWSLQRSHGCFFLVGRKSGRDKGTDCIGLEQDFITTDATVGPCSFEWMHAAISTTLLVRVGEMAGARRILAWVSGSLWSAESVWM
jgi:hypothetical protein